MQNRLLVVSSVISLAAVLAGCGASNGTKTLGELKYQPVKDEPVAVKQMDHEQVREEYRELIDLFEDKQLKEQIERRIADVYMMEGVQKQGADETLSKSYYIDAIKSYREILDKYPNSPDNAEVLYQLAKAYDMEGDFKEALNMLEQLTRRHPYYPNLAEAWFRMGDIYFSYQRYADAANAYTQVTQSDNPRFIVNAYYMLGWSQYKQFQYRRSLGSYVYVLNDIFKESLDVETLHKAQQSMLDDTLHSTSLAVDKIGGAASIETVDFLAGKAYVWRVYENLGDYYLEKELYQDSADAFKAFVNAYSQAEQAPQLHKKLVETYQKGGFPSSALEEKEAYIAAYGIHSSFPGVETGLRDDVKPVVKTYLNELAQHNHASGQDLLKTLDAEENKKRSERKRANIQGKAYANLNKAAVFYQELIDTFPDDEKVDSVRFLKAEVLFEAEQYEQAVVEYELVAYQPVGSSAVHEAANAGYAAIICYERIIALKPEGSEALRSWQAQAVESMLRFAEKYDEDKRSPSVLTSAAEYMFGLDQYQRAVDITSALIANNQSLDSELKKTAYGIMAHSYFKLENYLEAEQAYLNQRALVAKDSDEYTLVNERLASAIYKRGEQLANTEASAEAADYFLKIKSLTPAASIRATAQYDAVALLLSMEAWDRAIPELKELIANYSSHELAVEFPRQLAFAYEQSEQWALAADAYFSLSENDPEAEVKREALFLSANMHEKNKNHATAAELFKRYAYEYEQPFDTRMEARYHLAINYQAMEEEGKKLYWLRRIIDGDRKGGEQRTERSRWLGAWANMEYGNYFADEFAKTRLKLPLVQSLPRKNEKLQSALQRYQQSADYGFLEFVTESAYKIGSLYQNFSKELRDSPVPGGLSDNDRDTYRQIIEEQAAPFEQLARDVHQANVDRAWNGNFNEWIDKSFAAMRQLEPARYAKQELIVSYGDEIR